MSANAWNSTKWLAEEAALLRRVDDLVTRGGPCDRLSRFPEFAERQRLGAQPDRRTEAVERTVVDRAHDLDHLGGSCGEGQLVGAEGQPTGGPVLPSPFERLVDDPPRLLGIAQRPQQVRRAQDHVVDERRCRHLVGGDAVDDLGGSSPFC